MCVRQLIKISTGRFRMGGETESCHSKFYRPLAENRSKFSTEFTMQFTYDRCFPVGDSLARDTVLLFADKNSRRCYINDRQFATYFAGRQQSDKNIDLLVEERR